MSMIRTLFKDIIDAIIKWLKKTWFEAKLKARFDMIELENRIESDLQIEENFKPIYSEKPVDPEVQSGEAQKLGGEMRLTVPWHDDFRSTNEDGEA